MKKFHFINKDYLKKKDILKELSNIETDYYSITNAFVENGIVFIKGIVKKGVAGWKDFSALPNKYAPREVTMGSWCVSGSMDDLLKIGTIRADTSGNISLWLNNVESTEHFSIQYPLKVE